MLNRNEFIKTMSILFESRCQLLREETINIWYDLLKEFDTEKVTKALKQLTFSKEFPSVGTIVELINGKKSDVDAELSWTEVLRSAQRSGRLPISARSAKALNSLGGMTWLREAPANHVNWQKKEFLEAYKNTPEPEIIDFDCIGLQAEICLTKQNLLDNYNG